MTQKQVNTQSLTREYVYIVDENEYNKVYEAWGENQCR